MKDRWISRFAMIAFAMGMAQAHPAWAQTTQRAAPPPQERKLVIANDSKLPESYPGMNYEVRLRVQGGAPPYHWRWGSAAVPGIKLEDDGTLHGKPFLEAPFQFSVWVSDSSSPQRSTQRLFILRVGSALVLNWKNNAHVNGNRIEGSAVVTNTTPNDIDLTFIVLAVPGNGRATAIGYQHFVLSSGTQEKELPFGDTLPYGGYVVHVDAIGEVKPNLIYRRRLETPGFLQVNVGP